MFLTRSFYFGTSKAIDLIRIGHDVRGFLRESRVESGLVLVSPRHPGAAVVVLASEGKVVEELSQALRESFPPHLHVLLPVSLTLAVEGGKIVGDPWQELYLIDYETVGRRREVVVQIFMESAEAQKGKR